MLQTNLCLAQKVEYAKSYGDDSLSEMAFGVAADRFGNSYVTGTYQGTLTLGGKTITSNQLNTDIFLAKYNSKGNVVWAKSYGANDANSHHAWYEDYVDDVITDSLGNVYMLGEVNCSADIIFGSIKLLNSQTPDYKNVFVAKFDSAGSCKWITINNTNPNAHPTKMAIDKNNHISIIGGAYGGEIFGKDTLKHSGTYIATFDANGKELWAKSYYANINDIAYDKNNNLYCTGSTSQTSFDNRTLTINGPSDFFVAKIDNKGNLLWVKNCGSDSVLNRGYALACVDTSVVAFGGGTGFSRNNKTIAFGNTQLNSCQLYVVAYNSTGSVLWAENINLTPGYTYNESSSYQYQRVLSNKSKEIYLVFPFSGETTVNKSTIFSGGLSTAIIKLKQDGTPVWAMQSNTLSYSSLSTGASILDSCLYLSGYYTGSFTLGDNKLTSNNYYIYNTDFFWAKINTTDVSSSKLNEVAFSKELSVYPNPASDVLNLVAKDEHLVNSKYVITDLTGKIYSTGKIQSLNNEINVASFPAGIYFINITNGNNIVKNFRFIKK